MELGTTKGKNVSTLSLIVNKAIGSIVLYTDLAIDNLDKETINIQVERANGSNIDVTNGSVPLKEFILCATYGDDAITSNIKIGAQTVAVLELCEHGGIHLFEKDQIKINFNNLQTKAFYLVDGIEEPITSQDLYRYERKSMNSEHVNTDFDVRSFDTCVMTDDDSIEEVNYTFDNGQTVKYTPRELRALAVDADPVGYVTADGTVRSSFDNLLQLPLSGVVNINVRKSQGTLVNLLLRHDVELSNF